MFFHLFFSSCINKKHYELRLEYVLKLNFHFFYSLRSVSE